jgi:Asparagine synthase
VKPEPLSPFEIASGIVFGARSEPAEGPDAADWYEQLQPLEALEWEILPALLRPPCLVSFSGGRDSAAVLAVATMLARREGLPAPVPATNVFPAAPAAGETRWQELVIRHLGLSDWIRIEHGDELDLIGPYAERVLSAHGLLWPSNVHFHLPLLDAASGGSMLTGVGGDELFAAARRLRTAAVLSRAVRPEPRDVLSLGFTFAPRAVRQAVIARREPMTAVWLPRRGRKLATALVATETAAEPRRLQQRLAWWRRLRYLHVGLAALELTAQDTGVLLVHPLLAPRFWSAVATVAAPDGFGTRGEGMRALFGELLPEEILKRSAKAQFDDAFWTARSRAFARIWDGSGVPREWVDTGALARHWRTEHPLPQSFTLLQAAWLASTTHRVEQPRERVLH